MKSKAKKSKNKKAVKNKNEVVEGKNLKFELKLILYFFLSVLLIFISMDYNVGYIGEIIKDVNRGLFSISSYIIPYLFIVYIFVSFKYKDSTEKVKYKSAVLVFYFLQTIIVGLVKAKEIVSSSDFIGIALKAYGDGIDLHGAGLVGNLIYILINSILGKFGLIIITIILLLLLLTLVSKFKFSDFLLNLKKMVFKSRVKKDKTSVVVEDATVNNLVETDVEETTQVDVNRVISKHSEVAAEDIDHKKKSFKFISHGKEEKAKHDAKPKVKIDEFEFIEIVDEKSGEVKVVKEKPKKDKIVLDTFLDSGVHKQTKNVTSDHEEAEQRECLQDDSPKNDTVSEKDTIPFNEIANDCEPVVNNLKITEFKKDEEKLTDDESDAGDALAYDFEDENVKHIPIEEYKLPNINLLIKSKKDMDNDSEKDILEKAEKLENTFKMFKIDAKVTEAKRGPMITRFEVQPSPGVKISKISALSDDIALNLAAVNVRILAPIPGKAAVGIEVPNASTSIVRLRDVLQSKEYKEKDTLLKFGLGKSISGKDICADLSKMPHLLIAGATGSGKSVCVNTIITSILCNARPDEVKFLMIDPKVVELSIYNGIPHLILPVVTDANKAASALNWAVVEMNSRYKKFANFGVREINGYNEKLKKIGSDEKPLPRIVIIIDELADLMIVAKKQVEDLIARITQMARAAGLHLIVATQRPSVDVITGVIKANIPSRIAFAVSSYTDSRTIIDEQGAEKLLGKGDMLFLNAGESRPIRVQGSLVTDPEVEKLVNFVKVQQIIDNDDIEEEIVLTDDVSMMPTGDSDDELLRPAIDFIISQKKASTSMVQRRFKIGYNRAARLVDEMEEMGVIGPSRGSKPREVLVSESDYGLMVNNESIS